MSVEHDVDTVVVGAGFGGLRLIHELRRRGLSVRVIEAGSDVGGTWYWNRYPGARTDSESWVYCFAFDKGLLDDWDWSERFPSQGEALAYLQHAADRFDMRKAISFNTRVQGAVWDDDEGIWEIETDQGERIRSRFFITAAGLLAVVKQPPFGGLDGFQGEWYQTSLWPKEPVDLVDRRVIVVGTGASGVQTIPMVAHSAAHVTVLQRSPSYVMPGRNHALTDEQRAETKRNYQSIWEKSWKQVFGFPMDAPNRVWADVSTDEERRRVFDAGWEAGGFRFVFETFEDMLTNQECNDAASEFVRSKIRTIVKDPETAELLCPKNYPLGGKRIPLGNYYYEAFNRDNVSLVDVLHDPISEITPGGVRLESGAEHEADVIIFAIGFDSVTGALTTMDVRGRDGVTISERFEEGPETYLGLCEAGFPNMFMLTGPQATYANIPSVLDKQAGFIGRAIAHMQEHGHDRVEVTPEAARAWFENCEAIQNATVIPQGAAAKSWLVGADVEGKRANVLFHFGGAGAFFDELNRVADNGFETFRFERASEVVGVA